MDRAREDLADYGNDALHLVCDDANIIIVRSRLHMALTDRSYN